MGALMYAWVPGYSAIIFRRTITDHELPEGLIPRAKEWLGGQTHWNGANYTWTIPTEDPKRPATLTFGYMKNEGDHFRYQSSAYHYVGFDELPQFEEYQYRYMFSRLRRLEGSDIILRMRSGGNPDGIGVAWVKRRFVDPETQVAPFIPARLEDNPHGDREAYEESLNRLPPVLRRRLRDGDWEIQDPGKMFNRAWFELVRTLPAGCRGVRYWDLASSKPGRGSWTAGCLLATADNKAFYIVDVVRMQGRPKEVESVVVQTAALDRDRDIDHVDIWMEQEPGSSGVNTIEHYRSLLVGYPFRGYKETGAKEDRASPVSSQAEAGNIKILIGPWDINALLDELEAFPEARDKDQCDSLSGAFARLTSAPRKPKVRHA